MQNKLLTFAANKKKAYTLLELLVVIGIIGLLIVAGSVSYRAFLKQSRDAKRQADLELLHSALEIYKGDNSGYPSGSGYADTVLSPILVSGPKKYMNSIPQDPLSSQFYGYYYRGESCSGGICPDFTLGALLEGDSTCGASPVIECRSSTGTPCNYCLNSLGKL